MTLEAGYPSDPSTILGKIQTRLESLLSFPAERVIPVIIPVEQVPHFQADTDVLLRWRNFTIDKQITDQAGRWDTRVEHRLEVCVRTRLATDEMGRAEYWQKDATHGHWLTWLAAANALQSFLPTDAAGNVVTAEPLLLLDGDDPKQDKAPQAQGWGRSSLFFRVTYRLTLDQTLSLTPVST